MLKTLTAAAALALLAACTTTSPDVIQRGDAQRLSTVQDATVLSVRDVTVEGSQSGAGGELHEGLFLCARALDRDERGVPFCGRDLPA